MNNLRNPGENALTLLMSKTVKDSVKMRKFGRVLFLCANLKELKRQYSDQKSMTVKWINWFPWKSCQAFCELQIWDEHRLMNALSRVETQLDWNVSTLQKCYYDKNKHQFWVVGLPKKNFKLLGDLQMTKKNRNQIRQEQSWWGSAWYAAWFSLGLFYTCQTSWWDKLF